MWWFSNKPEGGEPAANNAESSEANAANPNDNQQDSSVFGGAFSFMKGIFGIDQLKVEEVDGEKKPDIEDDKRKGLFSQLSSYIGKDVTSMISLPVWVFEPVSFLQIMSEPLQYEALLQQV